MARGRVLTIARIALPLLAAAAFLALAPSAWASNSLSGTVTSGVTHGPVGGIQVAAYHYDALYQDWEIWKVATTSSDGTFALTDLPPDTYRVGFFDPDENYREQYWNDQPSVTLAEMIVVGPDTVLTRVNATLEAISASVAGRVTAQRSGDGLSDIRVQAYQQIDGAWVATATPATTADDGSYVLFLLGDGTYRVGADDPAGQRYGAAFYGGPTVDSATDVPTLWDATATGVDIALADEAIAPTAHAAVEATYDPPASIEVTAADTGGSGLESISYVLDSDATQTVYGALAIVSTPDPGSHTLTFWATDGAGNESSPQTANFDVLMPPPPVTTIAGVSAGWTRGDVDFTLSAADALFPLGITTRFALVPPGTLTSATAGTVSAEGTTTVEYASTDIWGVAETTRTATVLIDKTAPLVTGGATESPNAAGWYKSPVVVHFVAADPLSGVADVSPDVTLSSEGASQSVSGAATDVAGNSSAPLTVADLNIDLTPPQTTSDNTGGYLDHATISLTASDALSGVAGTSYRLDSADVRTGSTVATSALGDHTLEFWSTDRAGNEESHRTEHFTIAVSDSTPPDTSISSLAPGWSATDVAFTLSASDPDSPSGIVTRYTLDPPGGAAVESLKGTVTAEGTTTVSFWSTDAFGNAETTKTAVVRIDKTAPVTTCDAVASYTRTATMHLSAADSLSGVAQTYWSLDGGPVTPGLSAVTSVAGAHTMSYWSVDAAGNAEHAHAAGFVVVWPTTLSSPRTTSKTLRSSRAATFFGTASPARVARVRVEVQRLVRGKYRAYKTFTLSTSAQGRWTLKARLPRGSVRMRATSAATVGYLPAASTWRKARVLR